MSAPAMGFEADAPLPDDLLEVAGKAMAHARLFNEPVLERVIRAVLNWNRAQIDGGA